MPYGDATGPFGEGPRTGRGLGYCAGYAQPGYARFGYGRGPAAGFGYGWGPGGGFGARGAGRGRRNWYYRTGLTGWQRAQSGAAPAGPWYGPPAFAWDAAPTKEQQVADLKAQAENLESALNEVRRELSELEAEED